MSELPATTQANVRSLVVRLQNISRNLAEAAEKSSGTAALLAGVANERAQFIDETKPLSDNTFELMGIKAYTDVANEASKIGLNLLAANNKGLLEQPPEEKAVLDGAAIPEDPIDASRAYQDLIGERR